MVSLRMVSHKVTWLLQKKFVGEAMSVIAANTNVPVSVKCRIGVDDHDSYNQLCKSFYFYFIVYKANNLECCFI